MHITTKALIQIASAKMYFGGVLLALMMLHMTADVFMKYLFNAPITGTVETVAFYYMVGVVFLPLPFIELKGKHIAVDLLVQRLPSAGRQICLGFAFLLSCIFFSILAYQSAIDAWRAMLVGEIVMGPTELVIWPSRFILPASFGFIALISAMRLVIEVLLGQAPIHQAESQVI